MPDHPSRITTTTSPSLPREPAWYFNYPPYRCQFVLFKGGPMDRPPCLAFVPTTGDIIYIFPETSDTGACYTYWDSTCSWRPLGPGDPDYVLTVGAAKT